MTTHPVLGKFECSVCVFVMVRQGQLVESVFMKGFFFFYRISLAEQFLSLLLAPLPNAPSLSTVTRWKKTPAEADSMKTRDEQASSTSLICSLTIL